MMFVGEDDYHSGNRYRIYNPVTSRVVITCDAIWLRRMYYMRQVSIIWTRKCLLFQFQSTLMNAKSKMAWNHLR